MKAKDLRKKFLEFFEKKGHTVIPSASLVPENDPTVLFTTAGMHPLVPYILGEKHPGGKRLASVQKCIRTGDIEEVGDESHLTFFEMLGNWSLGDYGRKDAIAWSYEFLTKELDIDPKNLAITCFEGMPGVPADLESKKVWMDLGISEKRIKLLGEGDNFWGPPGIEGPCGPDTEMFVWTGGGEAPEEFDPENSAWLEVWNDVFMEYRKRLTESGKAALAGGGEFIEEEHFEYVPLEQKNVDTGMGLERMVAYLQGKSDIYETELFWPIIEKIEELSGKKYTENKKEFRIIADHIKAAIFTINDGVKPSNKSAGYVVRNLIRRLVSVLEILNVNQIPTEEFFSIVTSIYDRTYNFENSVLESINVEVTKKQKAREYINKEKTEMEDIMNHVSTIHYSSLEEVEKSLARHKFKEKIWDSWFAMRCMIDIESSPISGIENKQGGSLTLLGNLSATLYYSYDDFAIHAKSFLKNKLQSLAILSFAEREKLLRENFPEDQPLSSELIAAIKEAKTIVADLTGAFLFDLKQSYGADEYDFLEMFDELGLQRRNGEISRVMIESFQKNLEKHQKLSRTASAGMFKGGLSDDKEATARLHTAAHLMLAALREVLGDHVLQKGSNITAERLRFDFSHPEKMTPEQISEVEDLVNEQISKNIPIDMEEMSLDDAKSCGAMGVFEAKYGDKVKVYTVGDFSREICGGPHAENTGDLGHFKIQKEESSSAGVRRIKAVLE